MNESVALDLKAYLPNYMLHMIDQFSRYSQAIVIQNKEGETIVNALLKQWIPLFGPPKEFLCDNGLEFNNSMMRDLGEQLNSSMKSTAAESPWSNGINERHNGLLGTMVDKLLDQGHKLEVAVTWAVAAKNSLCNNSGFSPNQIVFGANPVYPNILSNKLPGIKTQDGRALDVL